jgi:hypothetical protein
MRKNRFTTAQIIGFIKRAAAGIDGFELRVQAGQQRIYQGAKPAQWMFLWNPPFTAHDAEHRPLEVLAASHARRLCYRRQSDQHDTGGRGGMRGIFSTACQGELQGAGVSLCGTSIKPVAARPLRAFCCRYR